MKLSEVKKLLKCKVLCGEEFIEREVFFAGASDLLSDILAFSKPHCLQLTGLTTNQTIYTCKMALIKSVVFVRGKLPDESVIEMANKDGFVLLATDLPLYECCGILYNAGLAGTLIEPITKKKKKK
jgi:hypothetical protein